MTTIAERVAACAGRMGDHSPIKWAVDGGLHMPTEGVVAMSERYFYVFYRLEGRPEVGALEIAHMGESRT